jgi:pimeloyl-ACP methyl ester carboxylesterase
MVLPFVPIPPQAPVREGFATVGDAQLWHWDTGGDGEAVVLCHPASQSSEIWLYQQPVLAAAGFRVIAYSRRGVFKSERGPKETAATQVSDLARLLDGLGVATAHVIGAAAGGITALAFAVTHPERTRSLVLAGTIFSPDESEWRETYARLGIAMAREKAMPSDFLELGPSYRLSHPQGVAKFNELEHRAKAIGPTVNLPSGAAVTWASIRAARVSTLLLTGEADLFAPPPLQEMVAKHMPLHQLATLREVGHAAYWEAPEAFNAIVLEFLRAKR